MTGFNDPVAGGGGTLVRPSLHSPGYSPGVQGWSINKDGSAEFNNLALRGTFNGTDFVINNAGAFFYSSVPGSNDLVASVAQSSGTDPYGNKYLAGFTTYLETGINPSFLNMAGSVLQFGQIVTGTPDTADAASVTASAGEMQLFSGKNPAPNNDQIVLTLFAGQPSLKTGNTLNPFAQLIDSAGNSDVDLLMTGSTIKMDHTGSIYTWQFPTMTAAFTSVDLQYTLDTRDNVIWDGEFTVVNATGGSGGQVINTAVPAAYRPKAVRVGQVAWLSSTGVLRGFAALAANTNGTMSLFYSAALAAGDRFYLSESHYTLGNLQ